VFGISGLELVILAVLALLVFGPDKLPGVAQDAGRMIRQLRKMAQEARDEVSGAFPELDDLNLADLDPRQFVRRQLLDEKEDLDAALDDRPGRTDRQPVRDTRRRPQEQAPPAADVPLLPEPVEPTEPVAAEAPPAGPAPWDADAT
jgi:sec-independent protein translocase protein TatB